MPVTLVLTTSNHTRSSSRYKTAWIARDARSVSKATKQSFRIRKSLLRLRKQINWSSNSISNSRCSSIKRSLPCRLRVGTIRVGTFICIGIVKWQGLQKLSSSKMHSVRFITGLRSQIDDRLNCSRGRVRCRMCHLREAIWQRMRHCILRVSRLLRL